MGGFGHPQGKRSMICREIALPEKVSGHLFVSQMPGRNGDWDADRDAIRAVGADLVICLPPMEEIREESPAYAKAIESRSLPWEHIALPTPDFGVVDDRDEFLRVVHDVSKRLNAGKKVVVHCAAGIGRSGTFAMSVLMALGLSHQRALAGVQAVGSNPEAKGQRELLEWVAAQLSNSAAEE
jgi:protein-tyrosine phosphatase